jgi:hypothetical protein
LARALIPVDVSRQAEYLIRHARDGRALEFVDKLRITVVGTRSGSGRRAINKQLTHGLEQNEKN